MKKGESVETEVEWNDSVGSEGESECSERNRFRAVYVRSCSASFRWHTQKDSQSFTHYTNTQIPLSSHRQTDRHTHTQTNKQTNRHRGRQRERDRLHDV